MHLDLIDYRPEAGGAETIVARAVSGADGGYELRGVTRIDDGHALYVRFLNDGGAHSDGRLGVWFGADVRELSAEGCALGGDMDISDAPLRAPVAGIVPWGTPFEWTPRTLSGRLPRDMFRVCFSTWNEAEILACIPGAATDEHTYAPTATERPGLIDDGSPFGWYMQMANGDTAWGYGRWQRRVEFRSGEAPPTKTENAVPTVAATATSSPTSPADATPVCRGDAFVGRIEVVLPPAPERADVLLTFDGTGSMGSTIDSATDNAAVIMSRLAEIIPDIAFGVAVVRDYPVFGEESAVDTYRLIQPVTSDRRAVQAALSTISAFGGGDGPEAFTRALHEAHADPEVAWRSGTRQFVILFADQVPHDDDLNESIDYPLVNPGGMWCPHVCAGDPGRDGRTGTPDDLDFQHELDVLRSRDMTLLFVAAEPSADWRNVLLHYWGQWTSRASFGGAAVALHVVS